MRGLWRKVTGVQWRDARIATLERLVDGQWGELIEAEEVVGAVMADYEQLKATHEREMQCKDAQIVALRRMLSEAKATWN